MQKLRKLLLLITICLLTISQASTIQAAAPQTTTDDLEIIDEAGSYPVTLEVENDKGEKIKRTIYVSIYKKRTVENPEAGEAIDAVDVTIPENTFNDLSDADLIKIARANAWIIGTNTNVPITKVTGRTYSKELAIYEVTFATAKGTQTKSYFREQLGSEQLAGMSYFHIDDSAKRLNITQILIALLIIIFPLLFFINYLKVKREIDEVNKVLYLEDE